MLLAIDLLQTLVIKVKGAQVATPANTPVGVVTLLFSSIRCWAAHALELLPDVGPRKTVASEKECRGLTL